MSDGYDVIRVAQRGAEWIRAREGSVGKNFMPRSRLSIIPKLEKLKAGLGAAGMAAMAVEAIGPRLLGEFAGPLAPIAAAIIAAIAGGYFASVSKKEESLELEAGKESTLSDASDP